MSARPVVFVAHPHIANMLTALGDRYELLPLWDARHRDRLADARALVVAGEVPLAPAQLPAMPQLGLIACLTVGYDGVDVPAWRARGIAVSHARDVNDEDVADHAIGLILAHRRRIVAGDHMVRDGGWGGGAKPLGRSLGGAAIGIVGMGQIGQALARRAAAMRMRVAWWGPHPKPEVAWPRADNLARLAHASEILVLAARAHAGNAKMVGAEILDALGPDGLLVNIARGQLVDEDALIARLRDGRLGGAALDVFAQEPTPAARWADVPNVVLTPHSGGATDAAVARMTAMLAANLDAFFAGRPLPTPVP